MRLWLDDARAPWKHGCLGWTWIETADGAIALLKTGNVEEASLDHDLTEQQTVRGGAYGVVYDDGHSTGYDVLCWLEANPQFWPPKGVRVHSKNSAGAARMHEVIERHYRNEEAPEAPAPLGFLRAREREEKIFLTENSDATPMYGRKAWSRANRRTRSSRAVFQTIETCCG